MASTSKSSNFRLLKITILDPTEKIHTKAIVTRNKAKREKSMKALIHTDAFEFEYCDVPPPDHQEDQLLIRIGAVGICGSDIHGFTGATGRRIPPVIMGHETAGKVIKAPSNSKFNPGARVALTLP